MNGKNLCYNCFQEKPQTEGPCPYCGFDLAENQENSLCPKSRDGSQQPLHRGPGFWDKGDSASPMWPGMRS